MTILEKILSITSIVLIVCTLICGLWLHSHPAKSEFHFIVSLITVLLSLVTIIVFMRNSK